MACPKVIKNNKLGWFLSPIWNEIHNTEGYWSVVLCAKPNSGKSVLSLGLADVLDRGENGLPRFSLDRVYFSAGEFARGLAGKYPKGTVHILDDAGLNLFSREAMTRIVMDVAKILQSVRHKGPIIIVSLPYLKLLDKVARNLAECYIQPNYIDRANRRTRAGVRYLELIPTSGETIHRKPTRLLSSSNNWLGYEIRNVREYHELWFDAPSKELISAYLVKKERCLDELYQKIVAAIVSKEAGKVKKDGGEKKSDVTNALYLKAYNAIVADKDKFCYEAKRGLVVDVNLVAKAFPDLKITYLTRVCSTAQSRLRGARFVKSKKLEAARRKVEFDLLAEDRALISKYA